MIAPLQVIPGPLERTTLTHYGASMLSRGTLAATALFVTLALSCSSSPDDTTTVTATIDPKTATTKILGKVSLTSDEEVRVKKENDTTLTSDSNVTLFDWAITEGAAGGGLTASMSGNGYEYVAPNVPGTYHVVITSKRDRSATATSTITVTP